MIGDIITPAVIYSPMWADEFALRSAVVGRKASIGSSPRCHQGGQIFAKTYDRSKKVLPFWEASMLSTFRSYMCKNKST